MTYNHPHILIKFLIMMLYTRIILLLLFNISPNTLKTPTNTPKTPKYSDIENDWCTPDSVYFREPGVKSMTYKSKHFINDEHRR